MSKKVDEGASCDVMQGHLQGTQHNVNSKERYFSAGSDWGMASQNYYSSQVRTRQTEQARVSLPMWPMDLRLDVRNMPLQELVQLVNYVRLDDRPNIYGSQVPLKTSWNIPLCMQLASSTSDREVVNFLLYGWSLNHDGRPATINHTNHASALNHAQHVTNYIQKELSLGCLLGPFATIPWSKDVATSPMSTRPKKNSEKRRIIMDLSWPPGASVNDGISKDTYLHQLMQVTYPTVDAICKRAFKIGSGVRAYKKDLNRAFKQLFMQPNDWPMLGISWQGAWFFDKTAVMGSISAPYVCQRTTNFIRHIMRNLAYFVLNYVDDFMGVEHETKIWQSYHTMDNLLRDIGAEEAKEKAVEPTDVIEMLGILFNFRDMTMGITPSRKAEILTELEWWVHTPDYTRKQLESLIGKLQFISLCVRPGRILMNRLWNQLKVTPPTIRTQKQYGSEMDKDIGWWAKYMDQYDNVSILWMTKVSTVDKVIASDACLKGYGGTCGSEFTFGKFNPEMTTQETWTIVHLELYALIICLKLWMHQLQGKKFVVHCDNMAVVTIINTGHSKDLRLQSLLREFIFTVAIARCEVVAKHIRSKINRLPDLLSRASINESYLQEFNTLTGGSRQFVPTTQQHVELTQDW